MNGKQNEIIDNMLELASGKNQTSVRKLFYNPKTKSIESYRPETNETKDADQIITITPEDANMYGGSMFWRPQYDNFI